MASHATPPLSGNPLKLKVALIVDAPMVSTYVHDLVQWAKGQEVIGISHLIIQQGAHKNAEASSTAARAWAMLRHQGLKQFATKALWGCLVRLETLKLKKSEHAEHFVRKDISTLVANHIHVHPEISASGFVYRYGADDCNAIREQNFDLLLRCGSGILRGEILSLARFGVLSFHHGDNRVNRGGPAGFWEVFFRQPQTGFVIQQLTEELDGGHVLFRGAFPTQSYWLANQATLYTRSNVYMKQLLVSIATAQALPEPEESMPYTYPLFRAPGFGTQIHYLASICIHKAAHIIRYHLLGKRPRWGVAFAHAGWKHLVMWRATRIANPPGHFLADPFVISRDGRDYCFVEDYDESTARACIAVYELKKGEAVRVGEALTEPFHLSFPYLFEYESHLYMVPESAQHHDIRIYECVDFPLRWTLKEVVMQGVSAADTMIFKHGSYWWLFTNMNPLGRGDHCSELMAYYSDDPINGEWQPHAANPLIIDPTRARNGGLLTDKNQLYRVAQDYGFVRYGAGAAVCRIDVLTPESFCEERICAIQPTFFPHLLGAHHLSSNGHVTAFDFLENVRRR